MKNILIPLFCVFFFLNNVAHAQPINNAIRDVTMPAPNAASLGKYGDIPVGYYTGVPNVAIPIHTITDGPLSLPVSLSYHAGGMKVGEPVSWVGLGWSLQAGGMISRTVQGKADESCDGYFMSGKYIALQNDTCVVPTGPYTFATVQNGTTDAEPDIFSFSVGGYNGKFFIEADLTDDNVVNGKVVLIPKQDVKIGYEVVSGSSCSSIYRLRKFTITIPDGTRYEFGNIDGNANEIGLDRQQLNEGPFSFVSSWYLRKVATADDNYAINLNYIQEKYRYQSKASGDKNFNPFGGYPITTPSGNYFYHVIDVLGWRLSTITTTGNLSKVTFLASTAAREDLSASPWNVGSSPETPKSLSSIKVESGTYCKQFFLSQSYYTDASVDNSGTSADKRLKLTSVQEKSCDSPATITINPYSFQYFEDTSTPSFLPTRLSSAVDHWGFYNGANSNPHSGLNIPATKLPTYTVEGYNVSPLRGTSNRETDISKMKLGTLSKVTYPTGGSTTFEYEANTYHGPRDISTLSTLGTLTRPQGYNFCSDDAAANSTPIAPITIPAASLTELFNVYYEWTRNPGSPQPSTCTESPYLEVKVYNGNTNAFIDGAWTSMPPSGNPSKVEGKIQDLFDVTLPTGVPLKFAIYGKSMWGTFTLKKLTTTTTTVNHPVGGLRAKVITSNDGTSGGQNVVKSYVYDKAVIPGQSSGILYNSPIYGYQFQGCLGQCNGIYIKDSPCPSGTPFQNHFFFETSVVPLTSIEGFHIGYSAVREYFNSSATGYYNLYQYYNDAAQNLGRIPVVPTLPRIGSGEIESQAQRTASSGDVAYDIYEARPETSQAGSGVYLRFNTYFTNGDAGGTPITFWKKFSIITRPFRYEKVTSFRDGQTTIVDKQYSSTTHLQVTKETLTNSDGKVTATDYKYSFDMPGLPTAEKDKFVELNLLVPLETSVSVSGTQVSGTQTDYDFYSNTTGARTSTAAGSFIRPYQFKKYEGSWVVKGEINSYHGTGTTTGRAGLPKEFTKTGWNKESYEWTTSGLIKKRTFKDFNWQYEYAANTGLVTKITNPDGQYTEFTYDKLMRLGQVKSRINPTDTTHNIITSHTYTYPTVSGGIINTFGNVKKSTVFTAVAGSGLGTQEVFEYFDGLGRQIETVYKGKATGGKDQIVAIGYDNQGRPNKNYESFAGTGSSGGYQSPSSTPSTETEYEANSLNRVWKVTPPSWSTTATTYATNTSGDGVKNYSISTSNPPNFAADLLAKITVTDGNGNKTITFTDKKGRMLLSRKANNAETTKADTYYFYDDKDRLVRVIPPGAAWGSTNLIYTYQYTNNDLISQKKIPGKGYEAFEYNSRDLPVKYQDPFLRAQSQTGSWMGSKYDVYGRLTEKGVWDTGSGDGITLKNKIVENIYGTSGVEIDKLKTSKVQVFNVADPVVTPTAANAVLQTTFSYDTYGRISGTIGNNHTNAGNLSAENVGYTYDHGDNILVESRSSAHSGGTTSYVNTRLFDGWSRLTQTSQNLNGSGDKIISQLSYTDKDQLSWKKLGNGLQQIDYGYLPNGLLSNINGTTAWTGNNSPVSSMLTSLNAPSFSANSNADLFREVLEYNNFATQLGGTNQYSGNIGQMIWQVRGRTSYAYGFTYDYLDRLTDSKFSSYKTDGSIDAIDYFGESQRFDVRGNITSITRRGMIKGATSYTRGNVTSQTFTAQNETNLTKGSSGTSGISSTYGTMDVPHNHLNLPTKFEFSSLNKIELLYDGQGNKLRKTVTNNGAVTLTQDYLDGIELKNNAVEAVYNEEGRAFNNAGTYRYEYALRDHLGNTRIVFTDKGATGIQDQTEILSETHYYPFGKTMEGAWYNDATAPKYKYLYNGKELTDDLELNFYDFGARWFDPGMASWWEIDPHAENYFSYSPYAYAENNPLVYIDPDGRDTYVIVDGKAVLAKAGGGEHVFYDNGKKVDPFGPQWATVASSLNQAGKSTLEGLGNSEQAKMLRKSVGIFNSMMTKNAFNEFAIDAVGYVQIWNGLKYLAKQGLTLWAKRMADDVAEQVIEKGVENAFSLTKHGELTNGVYTVSKEAMKKHVFNLGQGKSIFYPTLNAEEAVLKAAQYADEVGLWVGNKAKVPVLNTDVGTLGNGLRTNVINVYRNINGFIHGSPGSIR